MSRTASPMTAGKGATGNPSAPSARSSRARSRTGQPISLTWRRSGPPTCTRSWTTCGSAVRSRAPSGLAADGCRPATRTSRPSPTTPSISRPGRSSWATPGRPATWPRSVARRPLPPTRRSTTTRVSCCSPRSARPRSAGGSLRRGRCATPSSTPSRGGTSWTPPTTTRSTSRCGSSPTCSVSPRRTSRSSARSSRTGSKASTCRSRSASPGCQRCSTTCSRRLTTTSTTRATT